MRKWLIKSVPKLFKSDGYHFWFFCTWMEFGYRDAVWTAFRESKLWRIVAPTFLEGISAKRTTSINLDSEATAFGCFCEKDQRRGDEFFWRISHFARSLISLISQCSQSQNLNCRNNLHSLVVSSPCQPHSSISLQIEPISWRNSCRKTSKRSNLFEYKSFILSYIIHVNCVFG